MYSKLIGTNNPGLFIILVDQSDSMSDKYADTDKASFAALAVNRTIYEILASCMAGEKPKDRCHISVIGYGKATEMILGGMPSEIKNPLHGHETYKKKVSDGAGGLVEVEFLAPKEVMLKKNRPKLLADFRVLQVEAAGEAFRSPVELKLPGQNVRGATNTVTLRVASLADFLVMKAHAIGGRDKPKDTYDLCYCLEQFPGGMETLAEDWKQRSKEKNIAKALEILREKFASVDAFGPQQLVEFHAAPDAETQAMHARRAYELVQKFLSLL